MSSDRFTEAERGNIIEALAELNHTQWLEFSRELMRKEKLSEDRITRWTSLWIPYSQLPDDVKVNYRAWGTQYLLRVEQALKLQV